LAQYTIKGKEDAFSILRRDTSLKALMMNGEEFEAEESLLQLMG